MSIADDVFEINFCEEARVAAPRGGYTVHELGSIAVAVDIASSYMYAWYPVRGQKQDDRALFQAVNRL